MGGMKSGTGDVWGGEDDDDEEESESEQEAVEQATAADAGSAEEATASSTNTADDGLGSAGTDVSPKQSASDPDEDDDGESDGQPYVVRRMLKDKSVQFERDERLTLFVHDDVKEGEQELEAEAQELFGRDIPVFDIREAVYRAALRNRDDVIAELKEMGYEID